MLQLGDDVFGAEYIETLKKQHINTDHVTLTKGVSCGIAQITVGDDGWYTFIKTENYATLSYFHQWFKFKHL